MKDLAKTMLAILWPMLHCQNKKTLNSIDIFYELYVIKQLSTRHTFDTKVK